MYLKMPPGHLLPRCPRSASRTVRVAVSMHGDLLLAAVFSGLGSLSHWYDVICMPSDFAFCMPSDAYVDVFAGFGSLGYWYDAVRVPSDSNPC